MTFNNQYPLHLQELETALVTDPGNLDVRERLGRGLIELGHEAAGLDHLCIGAEHRAEREEFREAVSLLNEVLKIQPDHPQAKLLLPRFYSRVPRQPTGRVRMPTLPPSPASLAESGEYRAELFGLPSESVAALSLLLPFTEEDPKPLSGRIEVPLMEGGAEDANLPLLKTLDQQLRVDELRPPTGDHLIASSSVPGRSSAEQMLDEAFEAGMSDRRRHSPAAGAITLDQLPPNQVLGLLDSEPLERILASVDLVELDIGEHAPQNRALYVVVRGAIELRSEGPGKAPTTLEVLGAGDVFGEFSLIDRRDSGPSAVATEQTLILELPRAAIDEIAVSHPTVHEFIRESYHSRAFHSVMADSPLFSALPREVVARIAVDLEPLTFEPGDIVLRQNKAPRGMYAVVGGSLAAVDSTDDGAIVARLVPGDFFGVTSEIVPVVDGIALVATEDATLLWLPPWALLPMRDTLPGLARALDDALADMAWAYRLVAP